MAENPIIISQTSQKLLADYVKSILCWHKSADFFRDKMDAIDYAYARYTEAKARGDKDGVDRYGQVPCGGLRNEVVNPIVVSNVESMVAYWSEVFLSGYPRFPVVSTPDKKDQAEALEGIMQDHVTMSQSDAELQVAFKDLGKYNLAAVEVSWSPMPTYVPEIQDATTLEGPVTTYNTAHINKIRRLNLRNVMMDPLIDPVKVSSDGEFIGYTEIYNRAKMKRLLNYFSKEKKLVHPSVVDKAMSSRADTTDYILDPTISVFMVGGEDKRVDASWDQWAGFAPDIPAGMIKVPYNGQGIYTVTTMYARLIPTDFMLNVPNKNSPQIWKLTVVNGDILVSAEKLNTAYDMFPIYVTHALEDGLGLQTQSYGEMTIPIQEATTRLFNIRFQSANRAIQDRGLYNPDMIRAADINSPVASAKIAVKIQALSENGFDNAYRPLPFDARGTEGVLQDAIIINDWQKELTGQNNASRGQFQKGNKTMAEFETIMGNSENRGRLSALVIAQRLFVPMKEQLKLNILMFGEDTTVISPRTNKPIDMSIEEIINANMQFEVADGYTPKSKIANTDFLMGLANMIGTSPMLQQVYGPQLPAIVAHLAQLGGVRGFDVYADTAVHEYEKQVNLQQQLMAMMQQMQKQLAGPQANPEGVPQ